MMRWIARASVRFRLLAVPLAALLVLLGVVALRNAPVDVLPEFSPPRVEIQTEALGLSAAEVEQLITVPLEQDLLNGVAWLDDIHSESIPGLSSIELVFEPGTDVMQARQLVQERITQARALPNVSGPPVMLQPLSSTNRVMMVGLTAKDVSAIEMSVLARWRIKPRLMGVPGVANVSIWGQRERQLQVVVDPQQLRAHNVTLNQVLETTGNALWVSPLSFIEASTPGTGGFFDAPNQRLGVQHILPITTPEDLSRVIVESDKPGGTPLRLGDVASVVENHQPLIGDAVVNGGPGLMLVVEKFPGASTLDVTRELESALKGMEPGLAGIEINTNVYRPATYIDTALDGLWMALLLGGLLVLLVLVALFLGWRTTLVSAVAIAVALAVAGLVLYWRGVTFNTMILAGLLMAVAVIVSDAITATETIARRVREHRQSGDDRSIAAVVIDASLEAPRPFLYATLIIIATTAPLFFGPEVWDSFLRPLAMSYLLAVVASMAVALTVTPGLSMLLLGRVRRSERVSPLVAGLQRGYRRVLSRIVVARSGVGLAIGAAAVAVVMVAGIAVLPWLAGQPMLNPVQDRDLLISWVAAPGTSQPEMTRMTEQVSRELRNTPGVQDVGAHIGRAVTSDQVAEVNSGEIWVSIDPAADHDATVGAIQKVVDGYPGLRHELGTFTNEVVARELSEESQDVVVRIFGQDTKILREKAEQVRQIVSGVDGAVDARVQHQAEEPTVQVEVDLAKAQAHGIKPGDVRRAAATLLSGTPVGSLFEEQKVFDVVVWGAPSVRQSLTSIRELLIDTPQGEHVRLGDVAAVRIVPGLSVIQHDSVSRFVDINVGVRGRGADQVAHDISSRISSVEFPLEYHAEVLGEYPEHLQSRQRMWLLGVAAAIATFLLLQACFGSWRLAGVLFIALPAAVAGGALVAALWALGGAGPSSLAVLAGLLAVLGVAVRDMVLLVRRYQHSNQREGQTMAESVLAGAQERVAPLLGSTLAAALALSPLVFLGNRPGFELARPMAVVIIGGLLTAALFNLFVVPVLYLRFGRGSSAGPALVSEGQPATKGA
jgi:Cu/Ag efflux pump CusA